MPESDNALWIALVVLSIVSIVPTLFVALCFVRVNQALAKENRDLLKAVLASSVQPAAPHLAAAMEATDKEATVARTEVANGQAARQPSRVLAR
jgi:ABC-type phosphate transport system substrate-binding protein